MDHITPLQDRFSEPRPAFDMLRSPVAGEKKPRTRVLHIVPDLRTGGAETMLVRLINSGDQSEFEHQILSLRSKGDFDAILEQASIQVDALGIRGWLDGLLKLRSIRRIIRSFRPHIVHTWLYHANCYRRRGGYHVERRQHRLGAAFRVAGDQPHQTFDPHHARHRRAIVRLGPRRHYLLRSFGSGVSCGARLCQR
jgi:hypothetical protein